MAELEVDQSNLPRVQEVSQYFSVLEDGALAHNLQEQEIEQYYSSNVQRNQLVQKDIRVAKRLQDEEQQRVQMQATYQLEEQDLKYARRIQEEIQRNAEEERRREERDQEIAKQIQEEEVLYVSQRNSCRRTDARESGNTSSLSNALQPSRPFSSEELAWHSCAHTPSPSTSDYESDHCESRGSHNIGNVEHRRQPQNELPLRRRSGQSRSSYASQGSGSTGHRLGGWSDVVRLIKNDMIEQGYLSYSSEDELFEPIYKLETMMSRCGKPRTRLSHHSSMREQNSRMWQKDQAGEYRHPDDQCGKSLRSDNRTSNSYCASGDRRRRVRFQDDQRRRQVHIDGRRPFVENNCGGRELRTCTVKPSEGKVLVEERTSVGEVNRSYRHKQGNGIRNSWSQDIREAEGSCQLQAQHRLRAQSLREQWRYEDGQNMQYSGESRRGVRSEQWQDDQTHGLSIKEDEKVYRHLGSRSMKTRATRHSQLSATSRRHSPGAEQTVNKSSLDLCELRQVLQDEELAQRLQAEEEELLKGDLASASLLESSHAREDFTVAQVAQDEEIARFMQKQEMKAQLRSQELVNGGNVYRETSPVCDVTEVYDQQVQRERLNSEGLLSPVECSSDHYSQIPVLLEAQLQSFKNIAEQLDPTFQRNENVLQAGQSTTGACQIETSPQAGTCKEPAFPTATKRQKDKVVREKSKKENSKSKENCKQQ